ncbi:acyl-CoA thioesterase [Mesorhizobium sp. M0006]|uniref:acyl-CoA thioesterase n=1 Tax=Mesorhizobium sp. M0006 TaxID=2956838 RepID=UPI00333C9FE1
MNEQIGRTMHVSPTGKPFIYRHVVSFEETNVVGNVYFARHVAWQGRCREMFLKTHAPGTLNEIYGDLRLVTLKVSCEYFDELRAFDEIEIRMRLAHIHQHRLGLDFEYARAGDRVDYLVANGFQEVGCMRIHGINLKPVSIPSELMEALKLYGDTSTKNA